MAGKNKNPYAPYAFIGLIVAAVACVVVTLLGAAKGMVAVEIFPLDEKVLNTLNIVFQVSIALTLLGLAAYVFMAPDTVRYFFTGRRVRYGSNSVIMMIAFLGALFAANYLAFNNNQTWDWTEDQSKTLAKETIQTLEALPGDVKAIGFFTSSTPTESADELLGLFKANSQGKFDYEFVDPDRDPIAAKDAGITGDGKIMLIMGDTKEYAAYADEAEITKALIRLIDPKPRAVYFLQGHGEIPTDAGGEVTYANAKDTLESKNYTVGTLELVTNKEIPADALAIIIAGPQKPLTEGEVKLLKAYVDNGGSLFVMEDPRQLTDFGDAADPLADYLAADWGIVLDNNVVIDLQSSQNPYWALSLQFDQAHPITTNLTQNLIVILPQARSLSIAGEKENVQLTQLLLTTENSWGESDVLAGQPAFDPAVDVQGPLTLAIAGENSATGGRVVVVGNSMYAAGQSFDAGGNGNMFINSVDWVAEQENLLSLSVKGNKTPRTFMPPTNNLESLAVLVTVICALPGLIILMGVSSWVVRRRRG